MRQLFDCRILFCVCLTASLATAQESVNYASIGGVVTDASGAVVQGAQVTARQLETNLASSANTDRDGRFRFPYLRVGQYQIKVHKEGFGDFTRSLSLTVGSAFELPVSLAVASAAAKVIVSGEAVVLEAARSQVATTMARSEIQNLPLNGRNYFDVALFAAGRIAHQHGRESAFRGNVGDAGTGNLDRQPAEFFEQLHHRRRERE